MRFGDLTFREIHERARKGWLAIVPTGCTEQQGPHLPVDFDTWMAETVCLAAARRAAGEHGVKALVLPALPFGPTPEHCNYGSGYIHIPQDLHEGVVASVLSSLAEQGFRRIVVWQGCGGHCLHQVVQRFNLTWRGRARAFLPDLPYARIWEEVAPDIPGGHADSFATSLALFLRPQAVRLDRIPSPETKPVNWDDPNLDFTHYSSSGVIGDPTQATRELGATLWDVVVERVALTLKELAEMSLVG
jgi:creatinine amidohydrolase